MKKSKLLLIAIFLISAAIPAKSQIKIIIQPNSENGKDAQLRYQFQDISSGNQIDFKAIRWTCEGIECGSRGLIDFDLSFLPCDVKIDSAFLTLYHNLYSGDTGHSTLSGSNACWIRRVTTPWLEDSVTWNTQPLTSLHNQIDIPASQNDTMDYHIDVTSLLKDMINKPDSSHGFMLLLKNEEAYRSMIFASSDHENTQLHPKLTIYINPVQTLCPTTDTAIFEVHDTIFVSDTIYLCSKDSTLSIQPGKEDGKDAQLRYQYKDMPSGYQPDFKAIRWTCNGIECGSRGLIEFDISSISTDSEIKSAILSLYHNPNSSDNGHSTLSGSNSCWLRRVTSSWKQDSVTWNTQPSTTSLNQVSIPSSENDSMDYNIDVTKLVADMVTNPDSSHGFMLWLKNELAYRSLTFASSDHENPELHPKLTINYSYSESTYQVYDTTYISILQLDNTSASVESQLNDLDIKIYPNPANKYLNIESENNISSLKLLDISGKTILSKSPNSKISQMDLAEIGIKGTYIIQLKHNGQSDIISIKILIE